MERIISALIVKPNEKPILKEIYNSKEVISKILEIDEADLGNGITGEYEVYFPMFINLAYCKEKGNFPKPIIIISKSKYIDKNTLRKKTGYTNMTKDKAYSVLADLNIEFDEIDDRRQLFRNNTNLMDFVVINVLHNKKISAVSKALFVLIQKYNFDIFLSQITEHFKENIEVIEEGISELVKLGVLIETRYENSDERYFTINTTFLKELEQIALTDSTSLTKQISNNHSEDDEILFSKLNKSEMDKDEVLLKDIVEFVVKTQKASTSLLQRKFRIGYSRAARLMDKLEEQGYVSAANGSKPREVLVNIENL